jgi:AcrR family transcriptional regulator
VPRAGLSREAVVARGADLLEEDAAGLTLAALADRLGVRTPSLYKHVDGLPGLRRDIAVRAKRALAEVLGRAAIGRSGADAVLALSLAYRGWALEHPAQYGLTTIAPEPGDEEDEAASAASLAVIDAVLAGYGLHDDDAVDAARFLRSALHGFVALETTGGFRLPNDLDHSFRRLVDSLVAALAAWRG